MKKLIQKIKKYKWALLILLAMIVMTIIYLILLGSATEEEPTLTPVITREEEKKEPIQTKGFYIEEVFPPSGATVETLSKYTYITYRFSKPLSPEGINIRVRPSITLKKDFSDDMKTLYISPRSEPWLYGTRYTLTISDIKSSTGEKLEQDLEYEYYSIEPDLKGIGDPVRIR